MTKKDEFLLVSSIPVRLVRNDNFFFSLPFLKSKRHVISNTGSNPYFMKSKKMDHLLTNSEHIACKCKIGDSKQRNHHLNHINYFKIL